jgi:cytosine deaminase
MNHEKAYETGRQRLTALEAPTKPVADWKAILLNHRPDGGFADDVPVWLTCALALEGVAAGNFGVGAVLLDAAGSVVAQGHNEVFRPHFRSDRHAEMVVLDRWEDDDTGREGVTLYTSVEPCPMCLVRLSSSAVRRVLYAAPDLPGGMAHRMDNLPLFWGELARGKTFGRAACSADLVRAAEQIFLLNLKELTARMKSR